jgi:hypothetical protein
VSYIRYDRAGEERKRERERERDRVRIRNRNDAERRRAKGPVGVKRISNRYNVASPSSRTILPPGTGTGDFLGS